MTDLQETQRASTNGYLIRKASSGSFSLEGSSDFATLSQTEPFRGKAFWDLDALDDAMSSSYWQDGA
jgi:hypothetical protein